MDLEFLFQSAKMLISVVKSSSTLFQILPSTSFEVANVLESETLAMFNQLRKDGELCDVKLVVGTEEQSGTEQSDASTPGIVAHRCVLAAASPFFRGMFTSEFKEKDQQVVALHQVDMATLRTIVDFAYTGQVTIDVDNVQTLLETSATYQINQLKELCVRFMAGQLSADNCLDVYRLAKLHLCAKLKQESLDLIRKNFEQIARSRALLECSHEEMIELIGDDLLKVNSEETVFAIITRWLEHDLEHRMEHLDSLFKLVRLNLLSKKFFQDCVIGNELFANSPECKDLIFRRMANSLSGCESSASSFPTSSKSRQTENVLSHILVVSGYNETSCEVFNSVGNQWYKIKTMNQERYDHCVVTVNNLVYALGGVDRNGTCEYFNAEKNSWRDIAPMKKPRFRFGACALNGRIYALGGEGAADTMEYYDLDSERWYIGAQMNQGKVGCPFVFAENTLFAIGSASVERLDPRESTWTAVSPMIVQRSGHAAVAFDGQLYVTGGSDLGFGEVYDIRADRWRSFEPMSQSRSNHCMVELGGKLHVIGGSTLGWRSTNTVEIYDPSNDKWTSGKPLREPRRLFGAAAFKFDRIKDIIIKE